MKRALAFGSLGKSSATSQREQAIKVAITRQLSESIKELQLRGVDVEQHQELAPDDGLCQAIEAMFLHGLKDSLAYRVRRALADVDACPQPSFWAPIMVISHRQILDVVEHGLRNITTEVGQCRAWIRLALNDGLLSSYLAALQNQEVLRPYYQWYAFLRDNEAVGVARSLLEGFEGQTELVNQFPTNSSLLNIWAVPSLVLAGVWAPTMKDDSAYASGVAVDVARTLSTAARTVDPERASAVSMGSFASFNSHLSGQQRIAYTEEEALRIILAKGEQKQQTKLIKVESVSTNIEQSPPSQQTEGEIKPAEQSILDIAVEQVKDIATSQPEMPDDLEHSYNELFSNMIGTPDLAEMVKDLGFSTTTTPAINVSVDEGIDEGSTVSASSSDSPSQTQYQQFDMWQLAREKGLDKQKYRCGGCAQPILHISANINEIDTMHANYGYVCYFTGTYFCTDCMADGRSVIPARILHNWDFKEYPVSLTSLNYIEESRARSTIDIGNINPLLYKVVPEMGRYHDLRKQLTLVRAYLHTCATLDEQSLPASYTDIKDYMLDEPGLYSLADIMDVQSGVLRPLLEKAVSAGRNHVMSCRVCSQRGFLCEVCKDTNPIFPFDLDQVYRCDICGSVSHKDCLTANSPCRKCLRKKKKQDLPTAL